MTCSNSTSEESPANQCSILLVEDNKINQKLVMLMLRQIGLPATYADNGHQALDAVKAQAFDLILMDLHMPGMGGIEATQEIHALLGDSCPPIVALTADAIQGAEQEALEQGLDGYLTKPVNTETLRTCINKFTRFEI